MNTELLFTNLEHLYTNLCTFYDSLSSIDKIDNNDTLIDQLITNCIQYNNEDIEQTVITFIDTYSLYSFASSGCLERLLQKYYYLTVENRPLLYKHCIQYIAECIQTQYPNMIHLLFDHCTMFYNHKRYSRVEPLQHIVIYLPIDCVYYILLESISRDAEHIILFLLHYLRKYTLDVNLHPTVDRIYKTQKEKYAHYVSQYTYVQSIFESVLYKDEVTIVNTFLYGIKQKK